MWARWSVPLTRRREIAKAGWHRAGDVDRRAESRLQSGCAFCNRFCQRSILTLAVSAASAILGTRLKWLQRPQDQQALCSTHFGPSVGSASTPCRHRPAKRSLTRAVTNLALFCRRSLVLVGPLTLLLFPPGAATKWQGVGIVLVVFSALIGSLIAQLTLRGVAGGIGSRGIIVVAAAAAIFAAVISSVAALSQNC
jgi:hypothetical protein